MDRFPLDLVPQNWKRSMSVAVMVATCIALAIFLTDLAFRRFLPPGYVATFGGPNLGLRITTYMVRSVGDELFWRLLVMSALTWAVWRSLGRVPDAVMWVIIVAVQMLNIALTTPLPTTALLVFYCALRYIAPGIVWGWLYWRHGWLSGVIGHALTHLILDPILYLMLRP